MKNIYVDYENVQSGGISGINKLDEFDRVNILFSAQADSIKIDTVIKIQESKAEIKFIKIDTGCKNSLDFQLITLLFLEINTKDDFIIVSNDLGFKSAISMAEKCGFHNISLIPKIGAYEYFVEKEIFINKSIKKIVANQCGSDICNDYFDIIISGIKNSSNKQQLYYFLKNNIADDYDNNIYKAIRVKFDEIKDLLN